MILDDDQRVWLDEMPLVSHVRGWPRESPSPSSTAESHRPNCCPHGGRPVASSPWTDGRERHVATYTDPATGLEVTSEVTLFTGYPAVEWVLKFRNSGQADTPILENILPLDLAVGVPDKGSVVLHHAHGSTCGPTDFLPIDEPVPPAAKIQLAPHGGRSSNGCLPFFNLQWPGGGLVGAIGWSGQWAMRLHRDQGSRLTLQAGQAEDAPRASSRRSDPHAPHAPGVVGWR